MNPFCSCFVFFFFFFFFLFSFFSFFFFFFLRLLRKYVPFRGRDEDEDREKKHSLTGQGGKPLLWSRKESKTAHSPIYEIFVEQQQATSNKQQAASASLPVNLL